MLYFGNRLSDNLSRREPEGYLICLNVPVARIGVQEYLPSELGLPGPDDRMIPVHRRAEEVFSPACVASFEGMPVTDNHPASPEGVNADNIRYLQKGHAHNIRRGAPPEEDLLLADLIITDPRLIRQILDGKREISCGYNYVLAEEDGQYFQRDIRGNHVAVVDSGRAGPRVAIRDQKRSPVSPSGPHHTIPRGTTNERSIAMKTKNQWYAKLMARMARDGDEESLAEMIGELTEGTEVLPTESPAEAAPDPEENQEAPAPAADCGPEILAALNRIIELLTAGQAGPAPATQEDEDPADPAEEAETSDETLEGTAAEVAEAVAQAMGLEPDPAGDEDPVEELVAKILEGEAADPVSPMDETAQGEILSQVLEPDAEDEDENPEDCSRAADALRTALAAFRPQLARMTPLERQRFNADIARRMRKLTGKAGRDRNPYAAIRGTSSAHTRDSRELGRRIMATRNVNLK